MLQFDKKVVIFMKINENLFHYFEKAGTKVYYHPQDIIYMQEDDTNSLYLIIHGRVRVYHLTSNGEEITYDIIDRGRIFGESSFFQNSLRPTTVVAIDEVELISCHLDNLFPYLSESKELTVALLQHITQRCDYVTSLLKKAYTYNRYEKVASFLLEQNHSQIIFSHEEIASLIGLSRVTTTKVLNEFSQKGYIDIQYRQIKILEREKLKKVIKK